MLINKIIYKIDWYYNLYLRKNSNYITYYNWIKASGPTTLRYNYPLNENSIVMDVGGYKGEWSEIIIKKYNPTVHIFEPVPDYYNIIKKRFSNNNKIKVYNFGLYSETIKSKFAIKGESSGMHLCSNKETEVCLVDIIEFIQNTNIDNVDLVKINIEGAEYDLLNRMITCGVVEIFKDIQVQFHHWIPNSLSLRDNIINLLRSTHYPTYEYPFTWENWRRIR
jgi:FkbM family methyltransferase